MSQVAENKTFEQKMLDRVREGIGDLITDEQLKNLIEKGIDDVFFKEPKDYCGNRREKSLIEKMIDASIKENVEKLVKDHIKLHMEANKEQFVKQIDDAIRVGFGTMFMQALDSKFSGDLWNLRNAIAAKIGGF